MSKICLHGYVSGVVQGVWYRQSTRQQALAAGVSGWAKNLADGRVEVLLCGEDKAVSQVEHWLHRGPVRANVSSVESEVVGWQDIDGFETY